MRALWKLVGVLMVLAVCAGSLAPAMPPLPGSQFDKLQHLAAYGCLTWWWGMLYPRTPQRWFACVGFMAMGIALELAQRATGYRAFDVLDMAANGAGALLGRWAVETPLGRLLQALDRRST